MAGTNGEGPAAGAGRPSGRDRGPGTDERWVELGRFVREQRRVAQLSLRRLSEISGISNPYLSQIERGLRRPSASILQQLARALEIPPEALLVRAGIIEDPVRPGDVVAAIRRAPELTEGQKRTLIHIYESFSSDAVRARQTSDVHGEDSPTNDGS